MSQCFPLFFPIRPKIPKKVLTFGPKGGKLYKLPETAGGFATTGFPILPRFAEFVFTCSVSSCLMA